MRIGLSVANVGDSNIEGSAFVSPTNQRILVFRNNNRQQSYQLQIADASRPDTHQLVLTIEKRSIITVIWNKF